MPMVYRREDFRIGIKIFFADHSSALPCTKIYPLPGYQACISVLPVRLTPPTTHSSSLKEQPDPVRLLRSGCFRSGTNYHPRNLVEALDFVVANRRRFPFHDLVDGKYPLDRVNDAMADAAARRVLRAAIVP